MSDVTRILSQIESGDPAAPEQLLPLVYDELRKLAAARLAHEKPGQTLQATALVHEAYLRLLGVEAGSRRLDVERQNREESPDSPSSDLRVPTSGLAFNSRGHFFGAAAEAMRRILVENARRKGRQKRGGELQRCDLQIANPEAEGIPPDVLAVDEALTALTQEHPEKAELVKLRYFAGLTLADAAAALGISTATADRHWRYARAWLADRLREH